MRIRRRIDNCNPKERCAQCERKPRSVPLLRTTPSTLGLIARSGILVPGPRHLPRLPSIMSNKALAPRPTQSAGPRPTPCYHRAQIAVSCPHDNSFESRINPQNRDRTALVHAKAVRTAKSYQSERGKQHAEYFRRGGFVIWH